MKIDKFSRQVYDTQEVFQILMSNQTLPGPFTVASEQISEINKIAGYNLLEEYTDIDCTVSEFDKQNQDEWQVPDSYKSLDICEYILQQCEGEAELQRCGEELLMYQERNMFDLLRYMKYLVDTMDLNGIIWGVGRGSSVSSFVLYKLRVHRVNSLFYQLNINEFLR